MKAIQLRMARAAVGWGVRELAEKAGVTANTVTRIENGADAKQSTIDALQRALEAAGIEFTNGEQPGVRLAKAAAAHSAESPARQIRRCRQSTLPQDREGDREEMIGAAPSARVEPALTSKRRRSSVDELLLNADLAPNSWRFVEDS